MTIYLEKSQVPATLRKNYFGRKFRVNITKSLTLRNTYWSGGTRSTFSTLSLLSGKTSANLTATSSPLDKCADGETISIRPGLAIVEHSIFCGKDHGLVFHIHPDNASQLIPSSLNETLSQAELCLLDATAGLKSSYAGRKPRIDMMQTNGFSLADIASAKDALIAKKMLRKNGSITTKGRNARPATGTFKRW